MSYTYTRTRGSVSNHRSAHAIELSDWLTSVVTVATRFVSVSGTSMLPEIVSTFVPVAFFAFRVSRSMARSWGRLVCTRTCTGSGSRHARMSGQERITTLSTVVGDFVGDADGVAVGENVGAVGDIVGVADGANVGDAVGAADGAMVGVAVGATDGAAVGAAVVAVVVAVVVWVVVNVVLALN